MQSVRVKCQKAKAYSLITTMSTLHLSSHTTKITGICYIYWEHFESMLVGNLWVAETEEEWRFSLKIIRHGKMAWPLNLFSFWGFRVCNLEPQEGKDFKFGECKSHNDDIHLPAWINLPKKYPEESLHLKAHSSLFTVILIIAILLLKHWE